MHHNYTSHIKTKANDEIAQLAQNLNRLSLYLQNLETTSKAKAQSDNNKNHVVQLDFEKELNPEEFFSLFKRFEVILIQDSGKYKDCEIDERRTV